MPPMQKPLESAPVCTHPNLTDDGGSVVIIPDSPSNNNPVIQHSMVVSCIERAQKMESCRSTASLLTPELRE